MYNRFGPLMIQYCFSKQLQVIRCLKEDVEEKYVWYFGTYEMNFTVSLFDIHY